VCSDGSADFVDGTVFSRGEMYLTLGHYADIAPYTSDYTGNQIYYRSIQKRRTDHLTIHDYLWRWDTDWFWCSRAFGAQNPVVRRMWPKRYLRSDVYRKLVAKHRQLRPRTDVEPVIQDVEIPVSALPDFLDFFDREIGISPVWLCPVRLRDTTGWPLYPMDPDTLYVNVGFWSEVPVRPGERMGDRNRLIEREVARLGGHKSLYSDSYYTEDEFWRHYNGSHYRSVKSRYDQTNRLPDLYAKCVRGR
jgi:FAD/FMN-containing dehydrogenase